MPYAMYKQGSKWCVKNKDTGESKGCSDSRSMAVKHMKALYVHAGDKEISAADSEGAYVGYIAEEHQLEKEVVGYNPIGGNGERACANCQWFVSPNGCILVEGEISPTGISNLWRLEEPYTGPSLDVNVVSVADGVVFNTSEANTKANSMVGATKAVDTDTRSQIVGEGDVSPKLLQRITNGVKSLLGDVLGAVNGSSKAESPFMLFKVKGEDGVEQLRFMAWWSNCYEDRGQEIIPQSAHREFVRYLEAEAASNKDGSDLYPDLVHWHAIGTEYGKVDWLDFSDGFAVASGYILPGMEQVAYKIAENANAGGSSGLGMSHGSVYRTDPLTEEILQFRTFELSTLPIERAKNSWTAFKLGEWEKEMAFTDEKKASLKASGFSDEQITAAETKTTKMQEALKNMGVAYKDDAPPDTNTMMETVTSLAEVTGTKFQEIGAELTSIKEALAPLVTLAESVNAANASLDDKVADALKPKGAQQQVYAASKADDNVVQRGSPEHEQQSEWSASKFSELVGITPMIKSGGASVSDGAGSGN